ncbi:MAG: penicillin-binding protein, partial [Comamonadaceae bacterium]
EQAYTLGLDVATTIDWDLQQAATRALRKGLVDAQAGRGYEGPEGHVAGLDVGADAAAVRAALRPFPDSGALRAALVLRASKADGVDAVLRDGTALRLAPGTLPASARAMLAQARGLATGAVIRVVHTQPQGWRLAQLPRMEGALVALDAASGEIRALVGGFDHQLNQFDHATQAQRQPGSTFKPFIFSAGLEHGLFPGTVTDDSPREVTPAGRGQRAWQPRNYGDRYVGPITLRRGLAQSRNMVAINVMEAAGARNVQQFVTRFGFDPARTPAVLPLALGAGSTSVLALARGYGVFANGGALTASTLVREVRTRDGDVLFAAAPAQRVRAVTPRNAYVMDDLLRDVVRQGTARAATALGRADVAGKTGTSNDSRDVWFAGYASGVVGVVWAGYDTPRSLGRATGGTLALPIWIDFMRSAVRNRTEVHRPPPEDLVRHGGDWVYREALAQGCGPSGHRLMRSPLQCAVAQPLLPLVVPGTGDDDDDDD